MYMVTTLVHCLLCSSDRKVNTSKYFSDQPTPQKDVDDATQNRRPLAVNSSNTRTALSFAERQPLGTQGRRRRTTIRGRATLPEASAAAAAAAAASDNLLEHTGKKKIPSSQDPHEVTQL